MYEQYSTFSDGLIVGAMDRAISAGAAASLTYLRPAMMVLVALAAVLLWTMRLNVWWVVRRVFIALVVLTVLQVANYNTYFREPFWNTIPTLVASGIQGGGVTTTAAQRFDKVEEATANVVAQAQRRLSMPWHMGEATSISIARALMSVFTGFCFVLWLVARIATALLLAAGPFLMIAAIFDWSRHLVQAWFGKLVSLAIWSLMSTILTEVVLAGTILWVQQTAASAGAGIEEAVNGLFRIVAWDFVNCCVMLGLPFYSAIGGSAGAGTTVAAGMLSAGGRLAATGVAAGAKAYAKGVASGIRSANAATAHHPPQG
ncbi:hypothetical protein EAH89_18065 [Roseomonas nepalensis]|uniref:Type IV secretion system protein n=1 Tax=Muricoccus nepalensis TaxID=1854500 RepID=A0A502FSS4_9PROT|nr:type IV secretion system protein [Roseomonas nepalensis]TPG52471.1 hypothetical protein EAH89_18065 [Roseomonas nepalensis]